MTGQVAEYFRQGGIFMWPLLFFSLLALTVASSSVSSSFPRRRSMSTSF